MKPTFKEFLIESDDFTETVAELKIDPYLSDKKKKEQKIEKMQKVFDPVKWRKYLQYANACNN